MSAKFDSLVERLVKKMGLSQTPVPGFIIGLSGTDSIIAFLLAYRACERLDLPPGGMADRLLGVHYKSGDKVDWFEAEIMPWLAAECPKATLITRVPRGGNADPQRWADMHLRALNSNVDENTTRYTPHDAGKNYWVAGTINATEKVLGKFSMLAESVSIQLIQTVWKSEIMALCEEYGVPSIAMEMSRIPDCLCGRDEIAANNIELIDQIIRHKVKPSEHPPELLDTLFSYIAMVRSENDFKNRIPYTI
jgi:NH3-dependent NAD+ synthetase